MSTITPEGADPRAAGGQTPRPRPEGSAANTPAAGVAAVAATETALARESLAASAEDAATIPAPPPHSYKDGKPNASAAMSRATRRNGPRGVLMLVIPLLLALIVSDLFIYRPLEAPTAPPARQPAPLPLADVNPIGANVFMHKEVDSFKKDKTMSLLYEGGMAWIKQQFPWPEIEINGPGDFDDLKNGKLSWVKFDDIVARANRSGMRIIARLDRTPAWALPKDSGTPDYAPPRDPTDFANFVREFVSHYKGKIQALQIWNEPNLQTEWLGPDHPVDPAGYATLLKAAYKAAKAVDPNIIVLSAPLAITLDQSGNLDDTIFLERTYQALEKMYTGAPDDCRHCFDVLSANGFGLDQAPEEAPDPSKLNFRRVELLRAVMEQHSDTAKPVWFTEYGWNASPPTLAKDQLDIWRHVTQVQQADYTVRGIQYARDHWPWAGVFTIWYFRQVGDLEPSKAEYYFGMVTPEFVPEPVYYAVQTLANGLTTAGPGSYGPLSAPVQADATWALNLKQGENGAQSPLLVTTGVTATISLRFEGTDVDLNLGAAGEGAAGRLYVTVDGSTAGVSSALPRDETGRAYLDTPTSGGLTSQDGKALAAPAGGPTTVGLVSGLGLAYPPTTHQLQLQASAPGMQIAGFTVRSERSLSEFWAVTVILLLTLAIDIMLLRRWRAR